MSSKLRIRIGEVEIEYEGTEEFLKKELPELLKTAMELHKVADANDPDAGHKGAGGAGKTKVAALATSSIAAKLKVNSGPQLALAAAAHLSLVSKAEPFTREQLLADMRSATAYFKKTYTGNLTKIINRLVKDDRIAETATNLFALTAASKTELETTLANA